MPWELWWVWKHEEQRRHYYDAFRRVQRSPLLRDAVVFDDGGPDVPAWLRRIGFILSVSDDESFHMAPAEGMASRAVPAIRHWPGAETIYDSRWIGENPAEMAASIAALSSPDGVGGRPAGRAPGHAGMGSRHRRRDLAALHPRRVTGRRRHGRAAPAAGLAAGEPRPGPRLDRLPVFFTLAVSAATAEGCTALTGRALDVDPSVMPVPGPAAVAWRSADGRAALLHWGNADGATPGSGGEGSGGEGSLAGHGAAGASHAGTIWAGAPASGADRDAVYARTSVTRVEPGLPGRSPRRRHRRRPGDVGRVDVLPSRRP